MKKITKILFVMICFLSLTMTTGCGLFDMFKKESLEDALNHLEDCKNFTITIDGTAEVSMGSYSVSQPSDGFYKEDGTKQLMMAKDEGTPRYVYSELVDGEYITYDNYLYPTDNLELSTVYDYEKTRTSTVYLGIELDHEDFTEEDDGLFIGDVEVLSEKFYQYYLKENFGGVGELGLFASISKFNIQVEDNKVKSFDIEYTIKTTVSDMKMIMKYRVSYTFDNYGSTTITTPENINR